MTKQEEIDRLLKLWADDYCLFVEKICKHRGMYCYCVNDSEALKCLKESLKSQGAVIKVERELPPITPKEYPIVPEAISAQKAQQDMVKAGFCGTEPII